MLAYITGWNLWKIMNSGTFTTSFISKGFFIVSIAFAGATYLPRLLYLLAREIPERPFERFRQIIHDDLPYLCLGLPMILLLPTFFHVFGEIKSSMHLLVPVYADPYLADADRAIFGTDAWKAMSLLVPYGSATTILDYTYVIWFLIMYIAILIAVFMRGNPERRFRFFATYFMSWIILGNVVALIADSAGPCFYKEFYGAQPYQALFDHLNSVAERIHPLAALSVQKYIIDQYRTNTEMFGEGISAFPSLHVAIAMLVSIFFFDINKIAGYVGFAFCVTILIGSVVLGWHYAVDGLASIAAVPLLWCMAGWLYRLRRRSAHTCSL